MAQRQSGVGDVGLGRALGRGFLRRCPRCGSGGIFDSYFKLKGACPSCAYRFERESGYWVGAIVINMVVAEALFFLLFMGVVLATMPGVEWGPLLLVAVATNALVPLAFYPFSKTIWMGLDLYFHRYRENEHPGEGHF